MDIGHWLRELGLERYELTFRANAIDGALLLTLKAEDLKDLGVSLVGHRRKLLDAIAVLRDGTAPAQPGPTEPAAERRHLTVMFCDLVGSTALSTALDPEDLREIIGRYHRCVAQAVARFDGFIAKYMGDGVLVYFGYPQAHENDAERAVRTGLALVDAIGRVEAPHFLQLHVGIATGVVVVGDLIGTGEAQERGVVGETPNLAARLQALAEPNAIVIAESTHRQVGALFRAADLGLQRLSGFAEPLHAWRVLSERRGRSRFEALRSGDTPLVGRDEEIALLLRRWMRAKSGEGHAVLLSAEPGVGKSRLSAAIEERLQAEPHIRLRYFCSPYHQDSALYPIIAQLERAASIERDDPPETMLDKLEALLAPISSPEDVALLADLVSVPGSSRYPPLDLAPQRKKEKTFDALLHQLAGSARQQPVLIVFEDLHWIDPTSRELLDLIIERVERWPVLLIATYRPEFQPPWTGQPQVTVLSLNRLDRRYATALVQHLAGEADAFPSDVADEIVERCDGVPLFLEELTKAVLEEAAGSNRSRALLSAVPRTALAVPATLQASLMARLDRLGPAAKEVAQIGAAIGREFSFELLVASAARDEVELQGAITRLVEAGLVFQRGAPPQASFLFKHALVQDAAYGTLLRGPRQLLHGRIADALLATTGERPAATPEIIAHHLQSAGRSVEAIGHWREAGDQAVRRAANREAIGHFRRALSLLEAQPETAERWRAQLANLSQLAPALMDVYGRSAPEVGEVVERAAEVGRRLESSADLAPSIANLWLFNLARGRLDRADEISADLFRIAGELDDPEIMLQAHHATWPTRWIRGLPTEASEHIDAGLALYDEARHAHHRYIYLGHDPAVCALGMGAIVHQALGHPGRATRCEREAVILARRLRHVPSLANALWLVGGSQVVRSDAAAVIATATELLRLCEEHGILQHRASALTYLGWAQAHSGETTAGIGRLEDALDIWNRLGTRLQLPSALCLMAESHLSARLYAEGLEQVARGLVIAQETGVQWFVPRLYQVRAELLLHAHGPNDETAETSLQQAIAVAQQQGAKGWELQAATSLARLCLDRGRRDAARDLLAPICSWFTEGFDTPDLEEAKALLDELT